MVFHGDYEVEFEIYQERQGESDDYLLGHMAGVSAFDAKTRWIESHAPYGERYEEIYALYPKEQWR
tara:strand:- start:691 stop:888 length:198 start_codon:yes stop_codon:yes gene_type:complete